VERRARTESARRSAISPRRPRPSLAALAWTSAWLGVIGFGGGMSVLGTMRDLLVVRRRWLTEREFAVTATVAQMLPGGAAANALAYTGLRFHGMPGAAVGYAGFIAPGAILVTLLAAAYVHAGVTPGVAPALAGLNAAVVGVVASITLHMVRGAVARPWQMAVAAGALLFALGGGASAGEVAAFGIGAGLVLDLLWKRVRLARFRRRGRRVRRVASPPVVLPDEGAPLAAPASRADDETADADAAQDDGAPGDPPARIPAVWLAGAALAGALLSMAVLFVRAGLGAYGGGFAIIPNLKASVLAQHWITERQFADAVSIGKLTPGPVLLMATFIGYLVHGASGALVATVAVFSGPFVLVVAVGAWLARVRSRRPVRAALRGLTPAVVGLMAAAAITLGGSLEGPPEAAIAAATLLTLSRFSLNPAFAMALGAAARVALRAAGV
jgi:chromate transporter